MGGPNRPKICGGRTKTDLRTGVAAPPFLALIKFEYDQGVVEVPSNAVKPKEVLLKVF